MIKLYKNISKHNFSKKLTTNLVKKLNGWVVMICFVGVGCQKNVWTIPLFCFPRRQFKIQIVLFAKAKLFHQRRFLAWEKKMDCDTCYIIRSYYKIAKVTVKMRVVNLLIQLNWHLGTSILVICSIKLKTVFS